MSLLQSTVVQKYLKTLNEKKIKQKWEIYKTHFHDPTIQENIRNVKEEQYQEGFFRDLFVDVLGYTLNPETDFNLTTELKNVKDSKKADGGIIVNNKVVGVVELKGTDTTDLSKVENQAFGYKNNQSDCNYVIISNFEKLRFYIDNAINHIKFDLFKLTEDEFRLLYLCLGYENIKKNIPLKLKKESVSQEDIITKQLYEDYSLFKRELFNNLTALNPAVEPLLLFKKSQKLLDRFLFLFFAEDRHLLPPNSVRLILKQWKQLKELDAYTPLFDRFKKYFGYLNTGHKGEQYNVYPYNGGLFKPDEVLDTIEIDDDLLYKHTLNLSEYDFNSEVDVNILGHIFENSLNEIEEIQTQLEENSDEIKVSKRKKDGVFYTPKYITKYIVENTVGKLCEEQKDKLEINEEDYILKRQKKTKEKLLKKLKTYRYWLLQLTIVDPACGSGAFLNEALNFLIAEHHYVDELETKLMGGGFVFPNVENSILESNLFGVDINNESVEIAKLSLWLRTAQPNRKLNDLSNNIKCGNSLIDDPEVAGLKAFNWETEFPQVFQEKNNKIYHITTAIHDSRTSPRMKRYKVRERRDGGTNPYPNVVYFTPEDDYIVTKSISEMVEEDQLKLLAYNICGDHIHLLIACEIEEVPSIMQKLKSVTSRKVNKARKSTKGHATRGHEESTRGHDPLREEKNKPLWQQKYSQPKEVTSHEQLNNTINYIQRNRSKHELPQHPRATQALINQMCCTIDEAFKTEFKGGFDVVIGNPPYVFARENFTKDIKQYYSKIYKAAEYQINLYLLFIEKSIKIIKDDSNFGLIVPNAWLMVDSAKGLRSLILKSCSVNQIINLSGYSFEGVNVETIIIIATKNINPLNTIKVLLSAREEFILSHSRCQQDFSKNNGFEFRVFSNEQSVELTNKLKLNSKVLDKLVNIRAGLQAYEKNKGEPKQSANDVKNRPYDYDYKFDENTHKYLEGKDVQRYSINWSGQYLGYGKQLASPRTFDLFNGEKIIIREITGKFPNSIIATYNDDIYLYNRSNIGIIAKQEKKISLKYIVSIINSNMMSYYFLKNTAKSVRKMFPKIILNDLRKFPIKDISPSKQQPFIEKADQMLALNKDLQAVSSKYQRSLQRQFPEELEKLPKKLQNWYELSFADFVKELKKKKIKLSLSEAAEWEDYFLAEQQKALDIKAKIDTTDKEIDQMVYELYGLTDEEIKIVEES
ncbi:Eco57I restriction-modification methylase domain-containing protein [Psychroflexus halocasei]|uniref:site-specific DNA-methyltransferase (adenine-specific) n=1 Tax=Psychroflexus halocasei TaxID=908615 RepID=A0A1H3ZQK8_9FLAO|nr:TaqI-like C-terminal specificity domain-containing protein [Psychroflexus halocasei]SEA25895.1 Transposase IS200 like [Psychroflexus halocasei]